MPSNAARWIKFDFHVHTAASRCYENEPWSVDGFLERSAALQLDAVVISDHHTSTNAWAVVDAVDSSAAVVFPGMEVTTPEGHLLVIFDSSTGRDNWETFIDSLGCPVGQRGNGSYCIPASMLEAIDRAAGVGALAIPAHIDRWPNGMLERQIDYKIRREIHAHPLVGSLEITLPDMKAAWEAGSVRSYPRPLTCIQGSDAHQLDELGRRPTWVRMEEVSLAGLKRALWTPGSTSFSDPSHLECGSGGACRL